VLASILAHLLTLTRLKWQETANNMPILTQGFACGINWIKPNTVVLFYRNRSAD